MSHARAKRDQNRPHTKIVATIGPASEDLIGELLDAGMNVARLNFSHGGAEDHRRRVRKLREEAQKRMRSVCILGDLPGYVPPGAGFFLWLPVGDGEAAARALWREAGVRVLPGAYLGRSDAAGRNPGAAHIRVALVAEAAEVARGLRAIRKVLGDRHFIERAG